ncbi:bifunctional diguanylate cyclase/phosphodiesterase [Pseudomonas sp. MAHUQ-62]|uniref:bifunctional diguanylate cyclase/phosphodiesterase n=1 Tax=Pseudomonas sp. GCM10023245 TaxID=3252652 RepID=UPI0036174A1E
MLSSVLLVLAFVLVGAFLVKIAFSQNEQALEQSQFFAEKALKARQENQLRSIGDYAFWGDAYQHLHARTDLQWAYTRRNLGPSLFEDFGYEGVFVIAPDGRTTYSVIRGQLQQIQAEQWLQGDVSSLVERARALASEPRSVISAFQVDGKPALVAAAALTQGGDPSVQAIPGAPSVLLFADVLTPETLKSWGEDYALAQLRIPLDNQDAGLLPHLALATENGPPLLLRWTPAQPGHALMVLLLPLLGLAALIVAVLAWFLARHSLATAKLLDDSHTSLQASEARFQDIADASSDWFWETDTQMRFTFLSRRFETITGHKPEDWLGRPLSELLKFGADSFASWLSSPEAQSAPIFPLQCSYQAASGKFCLCNLIVRAINGPSGLSGYRGTASDTTAQAEDQSRIQRLQYFDSLTGLPNRNHLLAVLEKRLNSLSGGNTSLVLLIISLERFKQLNDRLGRAGGDQILVGLSHRLEGFLRAEDLLTRYTSDEFIVLLDGGYSRQEEIGQLCSRLIAYIEQSFFVAQEKISLSIRIGSAVAPQDADSAQELLRCAEIALYQARQLKNYRWCCFTGEIERNMDYERRLEIDLRHAIANGELHLHFQPRCRATDLQLSGVEALVRWQHPQLGLLSPSTFIPLAERSGLISDLGDWVLREACKLARDFPSPIFISVNLSAEQFQRARLVAQVQAVLEETGIPATRLELEITESMMLDDAQGALAQLSDLKALGIRLSMDDFGTGYSSLSYLRSYPFDTLKIDRSFIAQLKSSSCSLAVVRAIVQLAHALSMTVTAEGVETMEQVTLLRELGCDELQGFHLGRPVSAEQLHGLITNMPAHTR